MYLQALNDGFVVLEPGVEFLSVDNLPKLVSVSTGGPILPCVINYVISLYTENH